MQKAIAVYGGSFNPPTSAHFAIAEQVVEDFPHIEKVVFVPVGDAYRKEGLISAEQRVQMVEEVCRMNGNFEVSRVEVANSRALHTYETLEMLSKEYTGYELCFLMGRDNLENISSWGNAEKLLENYRLMVFNRGALGVQELLDKDEWLKERSSRIQSVDSVVQTNCSSTKIRERIRQGKSVRYLVPDEVYQHIMDFKLYV